MKRESLLTKWIFLVFLFAFQVIVEANVCLTTEDLQRLDIKPVSRNAKDDVLVLERDWWNGHYLTTEIGRILLSEAMGFPVVIKDFMGSSSFLEMQAQITDINFELWPFSQLRGSIHDSNIRNAGPTGVIGRVGLYFPRYLVQENTSFFFETWRSYLDKGLLDLFPRAGSLANTTDINVDGREFVPPQCLIESSPGSCDVYGKDYDDYKCNITRIDSEHCMTVYSYDFSYDGAWIHQQIRNLGLNWTVSHVYDYLPVIKEAFKMHKPFIVYSWTPNNDINRFKMQRINFREISPECVSNVGSEKNGLGSVDCDFQIQVILKIHSERLLSTASLQQAAQFVRAFTLTTEQQEEMIYRMGVIDPNPVFGADKDNKIGFELACEWVKNNSDIWRPWVVNVPPPALPYLTFWYNAAIIALFFTALLWITGSLLCVWRRHTRPLASVRTSDLILASLPPLFTMFVPLGILLEWKNVGCYSSLWLLAMATPIAFLAPLFMSYRAVIEVILHDLRTAFVLKRISNAVVTKRLEMIRFLKNVWCQLFFVIFLLMICVIFTLGFNSNSEISDEDDLCKITKSWRSTILAELIFYFLVGVCLSTYVLKSSQTRAFFLAIFPLSYVLLAVSVSALFQSEKFSAEQNPFSFNAVFSLQWMIAMIVYLVIVFDPAIRSLGSLKFYKVIVADTDIEVSLTMLLDSAVGFRHFLAFAREQFCEENVLALRAVYRFEQNPSVEEMDKIYMKSLDPSSLFAINISSSCATSCEKAYAEIKNSTEPPTSEELQGVFADVQVELRRLVDYNLVSQFHNSPHFENFVAELDEKEHESHSFHGSAGFRILRAKLGMDSKRSHEPANTNNNSRGSKHDTTEATSPQSRGSHSKAESKEFDFLGLPTAFSANTRVSKNVHSFGAPPSPTSPSSIIKIEMSPSL